MHRNSGRGLLKAKRNLLSLAGHHDPQRPDLLGIDEQIKLQATFHGTPLFIDRPISAAHRNSETLSEEAVRLITLLV